MDFAVPELITILIPKRLAKISVVRRPSIKLKITPHIQRYKKEKQLKKAKEAEMSNGIKFTGEGMEPDVCLYFGYPSDLSDPGSTV